MEPLICHGISQEMLNKQLLRKWAVGQGTVAGATQNHRHLSVSYRKPRMT